MSTDAVKQDDAAGGLATPTLYSKKYTGWMLVLLATVYASNSADRYVLNILAQPIKLELNISDTQLGLLSGLAFGVFYAMFGYPLARLSERFGRVNVVSVCTFVWSAMTALCGTAANFTQLMLYRFGVGIGESGLPAPTHSMLSDYYPPEKRNSAIALFSIGVPIGSFFGSIAGGWLAERYGWRTAFVIVSLPGFLLAPLLRLTVKEPPRGNWDASRRVDAPPVATPPLGAVIKKLFATRTYRHFFTAGFATMAFTSGGVFVGAYYVRRFHIDYATVGLVVGLLSGVASLAGTFLGGFLTDWFGRRDKRWYALVPAVVLLMAVPLVWLGYLQTSWQAQVAIMLIPGALITITTVPFYGITQNLMPARMRASAAAVMFFMVNIVLGVGAVFYGMAMDAATQHIFAGYGLGDYVAICGRGGGQALAAMAKSCDLALAEGTRWTLAVGATGYLWSVIHLLIASRTITQDMNEAAQTH